MHKHKFTTTKKKYMQKLNYGELSSDKKKACKKTINPGFALS